MIQIATLGEDVKNRTLFPLLSASREISVMGFFERVDILVVFILMLGILTKVSIFFYAGLKGLESGPKDSFTGSISTSLEEE